MLDVGLSILAFIVAIGVLVSVHEFGHFWVARKLGFKVLRFSVGFGNPLLRRRGGPPDFIEYWLSSIPLGGYVKMLDEREAPVADIESHRAFNRRPVPQRIAVLLAGPTFNFLFAILAYWVMFATGVPGIKPVIGSVTDGSVAARAGLAPNDRIESVGGRPTETLEGATLAILDELLADGRIALTVREPNGNIKSAMLDVRGREAELTEPAALFSGLGIRPGPVLPAVIAVITPGSAAERAGFQVGDEVLRADGVAIRGWEQWRGFIRERPGATATIDVLRDGRTLTVPVTIPAVEDGGKTVGQIGAQASETLPPATVESLRAEQRYGALEALPRGIQKTWDMSALTVRMLAKMVVGDVSLKNVSGPLQIASYAGASAQAGFSSFLDFLAVVSISLGILNLLPIPLLDGGQVVYQLAEWVKGSPLSDRAMAVGQQIGVFFLIVLMSFVFYNDITRMFGS
ncbi:MAG TPA: RIP metalloprotease RseP [Gammaproteobacteria bacterium]|nr:RIP metalloprotease RseP [Gammaproteobacteria bacterium]